MTADETTAEASQQREFKVILDAFGSDLDALLDDPSGFTAAQLEAVVRHHTRSLLRFVHGEEPSDATIAHMVGISRRMARLAGGMARVPDDVVEAEARWYLNEVRRRRRMT